MVVRKQVSSYLSSPYMTKPISKFTPVERHAAEAAFKSMLYAIGVKPGDTNMLWSGYKDGYIHLRNISTIVTPPKYEVLIGERQA